jgi:hypothetical protein
MLDLPFHLKPPKKKQNTKYIFKNDFQTLDIRQSWTWQPRKGKHRLVLILLLGGTFQAMMQNLGRGIHSPWVQEGKLGGGEAKVAEAHRTGYQRRVPDVKRVPEVFRVFRWVQTSACVWGCYPRMGKESTKTEQKEQSPRFTLNQKKCLFPPTSTETLINQGYWVFKRISSLSESRFGTEKFVMDEGTCNTTAAISRSGVMGIVANPSKGNNRS